MKNLIRAQLFQLKKGKLILLVNALVLFMQLVEVVSGVFDGVEHINFAEFVSNYAIAFYAFATVAAVITAIICVGGDFLDKTFNYEIMNGHTRLEIFASKAIVGIMAGGVSYIINLAVPYILGIALLGFGKELNAGDVLLRLVLSLIVAIRVICIFIALTYMVRIYWALLPAVFFYFVAGIEIVHYVSNRSVLLGLSCFATLSEYVSWTTYTLGEQVNFIYVYGRRILAGESLAMIASSIVIGAVALIIGYIFFKKDDLH